MATPIPSNRASFAVDEIALAVRGTVARPPARTEPLVSIVSDSRAVGPGAVFVALRGETHDGHAFLEAARRAGAGLVVVERGRVQEGARRDGVGVVEVDDTLLAWGDLARAHLSRWRSRAVDACVVVITGSAGKTTTKELVAALLGQCGPTHFTAGNLNNRIGVPSVVFALTEAHRFCVLEVGMSLPGEIDAIMAFVRPDVAIVTNIGVAHAEGVGGLAGVTREKGAVYRALEEGGVAIVNADDDRVVQAAEGTRARRVETFGLTDEAHYRLISRAADPAGSRVVISCAGRTIGVHLPLPGRVAAIDLAAALAAQEAASREILAEGVIARALGSVRLSGRSSLRRLSGDVVVLDDTYNANPASMRAALETLGEIAEGRRRVAIVGEMKELGALAEAEHDALGDAIAGAGVALAIGCGGLVTRSLERAAGRGVEVFSAATTEEAAREAAVRVRPGDAVLVKGSRGVAAERIVAALVAERPEVLPISGKSASSVEP